MKNKAKLKNRQTTATTTNNDLHNTTHKTKCEDSKWVTRNPSAVNGRRDTRYNGRKKKNVQ